MRPGLSIQSSRWVQRQHWSRKWNLRHRRTRHNYPWYQMCRQIRHTFWKQSLDYWLGRHYDSLDFAVGKKTYRNISNWSAFEILTKLYTGIQRNDPKTVGSFCRIGGIVITRNGGFFTGKPTLVLPYWFVGFVEGDVAILAYQSKSTFVITQKDSNVLYLIKDILGSINRPTDYNPLGINLEYNSALFDEGHSSRHHNGHYDWKWLHT